MRKSNAVALMAAWLAIAPAMGQGPQEAPAKSWMMLSGRVVNAGPASFRMDYGTGEMTVEMDDWDWYQEGKGLRPGDPVVVSGRIDDALFHRRTIEAESVYVKRLNSFFYADAADEESASFLHREVPDGSWITVTGVVEKSKPKSVRNADAREFTLDTGAVDLKVDTDWMEYNPLDRVGEQQIRPGDRVQVSGTWEADFVEANEIQARSILILRQDRARAGTR